VFINTHTHARLHDAKIELVNLMPGALEKPDYYSYGIHPWYVDANHWEHQLNELSLAVNEKRCLALGECGLDKVCKIDFQLQLKVFEKQVVLANEMKKPLIIHCVKAFNELMNVLNQLDNEMPVVIHGFNNNENIARVLLDYGCYFSFGKALLGYESNAAKALKSVGRKRFFLETDDADVSIKYIYHKAAGLLGIDETILKQQVAMNFETVFKITVT
jgi:TatD DNase family protein